MLLRTASALVPCWAKCESIAIEEPDQLRRGISFEGNNFTPDYHR